MGYTLYCQRFVDTGQVTASISLYTNCLALSIVSGEEPCLFVKVRCPHTLLHIQTDSLMGQSC